MKTLEEIKDEYAEIYSDTWNGWTDDGRNINEDDVNEVARMYAKEAAEETLKNAADNSKVKRALNLAGTWTNTSDKSFLGDFDRAIYSVDKESIISENNIPEL